MARHRERLLAHHSGARYVAAAGSLDAKPAALTYRETPLPTPGTITVTSIWTWLRNPT